MKFDNNKIITIQFIVSLETQCLKFSENYTLFE
jgi:hypothetical protein